MLFNISIMNVGYSASLTKNANVKSVLDDLCFEFQSTFCVIFLAVKL